MRDLHMKNPADPAGSAGELGWIIPYIPAYIQALILRFICLSLFIQRISH